MSGELDVYQNCPCGSGKKLKFCCHAIVGEMQRVAEMQQHRQYEMALSVLDSLEKKNLKEAPSRAWVKTTKAMIYSATGRNEEARTLARAVLDDVPGHPLATIINAMLTLAIEGYPAAKRAIYEVLELDRERSPGFMIAHLLRNLSGLLLEQGHVLAACEHAGMSASYEPDDEEAIRELLELQRETTLPYPLRGSYELAPFAGEESRREAYDQAVQIAGQGRFSDAAKAFGAIARQDPNQGWVWWNIGLCHAWAAEDPLAVQALKAAAGHQMDVEVAADCLLLARLLTPIAPEKGIVAMSRGFKVHSVSRLLTTLDQQTHFDRLSVPPRDEDEGGLPPPVASYAILDRAKDQTPVAELTLDTVPRLRGQIDIYEIEHQGERNGRAVVNTLGRDVDEAVHKQLMEIVGTELEQLGEPAVGAASASEVIAMRVDFHLPEATPSAVFEAIHDAHWRKVVDQVWPNLPQESLGGKSPVEAAQAPELRAATIAAVLALDVTVEQSRFILDQDEIRHRLGLPAITQLDIPPEDNLRQYSILEARRFPIDRLSDEQLVVAMNRVVPLGHTGLSLRITNAALQRPGLTEKLDASRLHLMLANLNRKVLRMDAALEEVVRGKQIARDRKQSVDAMLAWELEELLLRAGRDPHDPQVAELAGHLWSYYRVKLPKAGGLIDNILNQLPITGPWRGDGAMLAGAGAPIGSTTAGGLWTPDAPAPTGASKLWLPGEA